MKLDEIRAAYSLATLTPAIKFLAERVESLSWGEFNAYKRTIENKANELGIDLKTVNEIASEHQVFGYERN